MKTQTQMPQPLPNSLTEIGRESRDNGTLQGWWRCAIGDVRNLLGAAKRGEEVEENLDRTFAILERLRLTAQDRVRRACSCEGSQVIEQSLARLHADLYGAMMDVLLAAAIAESAWGRGNPLTGPITSALRQLPTLAEIGKLAPELGSVWRMGASAVPMMRQGAPTRCRFCGS